MGKSEKVLELRRRVETAKGELQHIGVIKSPKYYFALKYPQFSDKIKLDNLWRGLSTDQHFTECLEAFVQYKTVEYS